MRRFAAMVLLLSLGSSTACQTEPLTPAHSPSLDVAAAEDGDEDGVPDDIDNCPTSYNPDQADRNGNGIGDTCDPTIDLGGPYIVAEGDTVTVHGSFTYASPYPPFVIGWDYGDGSEPTPDSTHVYLRASVYTLKATVGFQTDSTTVTVTNVAPTVTISAGPSPLAGSPYTLNATFSDVGTLDGPWTYDISWGDGSHTTGVALTIGGITATHEFKQAGAYNVSVIVTDQAGGAGTAAYPLTVLRRNGRLPH